MFFCVCSVGNWTKEPAIIETTETEGTTLVFDSIDLKNGRARLIGNQAAVDCFVLESPVSLTFVEVTPIGTQTFTTVFTHYIPGTKDFVAITSRHLYYPGIGPLVSQYYGKAKIFE